MTAAQTELENKLVVSYKEEKLAKSRLGKNNEAQLNVYKLKVTNRAYLENLFISLYGYEAYSELFYKVLSKI